TLRSTPPSPTPTYPLSLHDALPIYVAPAEEHCLEPVDLVPAGTTHVDSGLARQPPESRAIIRVQVLLERRQGQRPVHQPSIDEVGTDPNRQCVPDRALAGS